MFLNAQALITHLESNSDSPQQQLLAHPLYRGIGPGLMPSDYAPIARRLHAAWATEHALRASIAISDGEYLIDSMDWTLKQAYFAIFGTLQAFLYTQGISSTRHEVVLREAGRMVVKNAYPRAASFYAAGAYGDFSMHRLPLSDLKTGGEMPEVAAQTSLAGQLAMCRKVRAKAVRAEVQANANTAIRSQKTGKPLDVWAPTHWQQITWRLGYTTVFGLLAHLRDGDASLAFPTIAARSPARLVAFHEDLLAVINYLSSVHEAYIARSMGSSAYYMMVLELPSHLRNTFVDDRFDAWLKANVVDNAMPVEPKF